jgi:hypothetical protein
MDGELRQAGPHRRIETTRASCGPFIRAAASARGNAASTGGAATPGFAARPLEPSSSPSIAVSPRADVVLHPQEIGCHCIDLVTPTHLVPNVVSALEIATELSSGEGTIRSVQEK